MIVGWGDLSGLLKTFQVFLIIAPPSTGKRTFALSEFGKAGRHGFDLLAPKERMTPAVAREAIDFLSYKSGGRWAILRLQQERPQNILLKTLEEPPPNTKILLLAEQDPLPTVMSRAQITLKRGPLSPEELTQIDPGLSARASQAGGVRQAREIASTERFRVQAIQAGQAVCTLNRELLRRSLEGWTQECSDALVIWAAESASGVPRVHTASELGDRTVAYRVLFGVNSLGQANPALAASAALNVAFKFNTRKNA